jgi:hypothetical protein
VGVAAEFHIHFKRYLNAQGSSVGELRAFAQDASELQHAIHDPVDAGSTFAKDQRMAIGV